MTPNQFLKIFPKDLNYRFVDSIALCTDDKVVADYTYPSNADYYKGHFKNYPVTPGTILMETMIQCGASAYGKYLAVQEGKDCTTHHVVILRSQAKFLKMVRPEEKVIVESRVLTVKKGLGFFKMTSVMKNQNQDVICKGNFTCKIFETEEIV